MASNPRDFGDGVGVEKRWWKAVRSRALLSGAALSVWLLGSAATADAASRSSAETTTAADYTSTDHLKLHLIWQDGNRQLPFNHEVVGREVQNVLGGLGLRVTWRRGSPAGSNGMGDYVVRVVLSGEPSTWGLNPMAMGVVFGTDGPGAVVYICYPAVARTLGWSPDAVIARVGRRLPPFQWQLILKRALGRVIAHEIFHAVAPGLAHAPYGLTRACLDRDFLVGDTIDIHPYAAEVFRTRLAALCSGTGHPSQASEGGQVEP